MTRPCWHSQERRESELLSLLSSSPRPPLPTCTIFFFCETSVDAVVNLLLPYRFLSCSHTLSSHSLSLSRQSLWPLHDHHRCGFAGNMYWKKELRGCRLVRGQLRGGQLVMVAACATRMAKLWLPDIVPLSPATLTFSLGSQSVLLGLLITMVPFVYDKSVQIINTLFCAEMANFVG